MTSKTSVVVGVLDAQRDVRLAVSRLQAVAQIWRLVTYLPSRPASGEVLTQEVHRQRRLVDLEQRQRRRAARGRSASTPMPMSSMPVIEHDVAGPASVDRLALEALERQHLVDAAP